MKLTEGDAVRLALRSEVSTAKRQELLKRLWNMNRQPREDTQPGSARQFVVTRASQPNN